MLVRLVKIDFGKGGCGFLPNFGGLGGQLVADRWFLSCESLGLAFG